MSDEHEMKEEAKDSQRRSASMDEVSGGNPVRVNASNRKQNDGSGCC